MINCTPAKPADHIPVADLAGSFIGDGARKAAVAAKIHKASRDTGYFYIANHGIDQSVIDRAFTAAKSLFALPLAQKKRISAANWLTTRGWEPIGARTFDEGTAPDLMESFYIGREQALDHPYVKQSIRGYGPNQRPEGAVLQPRLFRTGGVCAELRVRDQAAGPRAVYGR